MALAWDAPAEDAGSVTGYEIRRGQGAVDPATLAADPGRTAATASESYSYSVKAVQGGERSQASGEAVVQLPAGRPTPERLT